MMLKREIDLIINTPTAGKIPYTDGFYIRRYAVDLGIPYITTITAASAAVKAMDSIRKGGITIRSLDDYHKGKSPIRKLEEFC